MHVRQGDKPKEQQRQTRNPRLDAVALVAMAAALGSSIS